MIHRRGSQKITALLQTPAGSCRRLEWRSARAAGIIGADVFTGKMVRGRVLPMNKKAWAAKFKKYAVLAGVNEAKKSCHGVRKARAEVAAYADCTESQMMAMLGWTNPKMPAHLHRTSQPREARI